MPGVLHYTAVAARFGVGDISALFAIPLDEVHPHAGMLIEFLVRHVRVLGCGSTIPTPVHILILREHVDGVNLVTLLTFEEFDVQHRFLLYRE